MARPRVVTNFRQICREIVLSKKVMDQIRALAEKDGAFALDVAAHGFGRPPQSLDITQNTTINITFTQAFEALTPEQKTDFIEHGRWPLLLPEAS